MGEPNVFHFALAQLIAAEWGVSPSTGSLLMAAEIIQRETQPLREQRSEMLAALKRLLATINVRDAENHTPGCRCVIHEARYVIAKAEGGDQS